MSIINIQQVNLIKPSTFPAFDKYENNAYGINIEYPHSWEKVDFSAGGLVVGFVSNDRQESGLPENVVIQTSESKSYNGLSPMELATRAISLTQIMSWVTVFIDTNWLTER